MTIEQIKEELWAGIHGQTTATLINNLAATRLANVQLQSEVVKLTAEIAELKKKSEPAPVILTPPIPPAAL